MRGAFKLTMMKKKSPFFFFALFCFRLLFLLPFSIAEDLRHEGWSIPDLTGLVPYSITIRTVDRIEVIVEKFYTREGGHVARISGNGKIYAYAIDSDRMPPIDYLLLDPDGTGRFSKRLKFDETYFIPDWVH